MAHGQHAGGEAHVFLDEVRRAARVLGGVAAEDLARHEEAVDGQQPGEPLRGEERGPGHERLHDEVRREQRRLPEVAALGLAEQERGVDRGQRRRRQR